MFFLAILPFFSFGQIQGKYCIEGYSVTCIDFLLDKTFEFRQDRGLAIVTGSGAYELNENLLILKFHGTPGDTVQHVVSIDTLDFEPVEARLNLSVIDLQRKNPMEHVSFSVTDFYGKKVWAKTDEEGNGSISIEHFKRPMKLSIASVGYSEFELVLGGFQTYSMKVQMRPWTMGFLDKESQEYKVISFKNGKHIRLKAMKRGAKSVKYKFREPIKP